MTGRVRILEVCKLAFETFVSVFADALQWNASQFERQAGKLKRKSWLQNLKVGAADVGNRAVNQCYGFR